MKKSFFVTILLLASLIGVAPRARADEASKQAKAAKLVETMHMEQNMVKMLDTVSAQMKQSFSSALGDNATPRQKEIFNNFTSQVLQLMRTQLSWSVLKPDMVKLYASNFTEDELDGLNAFYASPVGQSSLEKMPMVMQQSMATTQAHLVTLQPQIKALQESFAKDMAAAEPGASERNTTPGSKAPAKH